MDLSLSFFGCVDARAPHSIVKARRRRGQGGSGKGGSGNCGSSMLERRRTMMWQGNAAVVGEILYSRVRIIKSVCESQDAQRQGRATQSGCKRA